MNFPANLKYTKDHEWVRVEGNVAVVGITEFAQGELGDIVYVEIETKGEGKPAPVAAVHQRHRHVPRFHSVRRMVRHDGRSGTLLHDGNARQRDVVQGAGVEPWRAERNHFFAKPCVDPRGHPPHVRHRPFRRMENPQWPVCGCFLAGCFHARDDRLVGSHVPRSRGVQTIRDLRNICVHCLHDLGKGIRIIVREAPVHGIAPDVELVPWNAG